MNVYVYTLGCRVNQCESEAIAQAFADSGNCIVKNSSQADIVIVNTCTVTGKAEQKARRVIRIFAKNAVTLVTGCYAQVDPKSIMSLSDNVFVLPLTKKADLLNLPSYIDENKDKSLADVIGRFTESGSSHSYSVFDYAATGFSYHSRSYLKIQDGCDNNCGFCRVHIARGKSSFLDADTVVKRALEIEKAGYHEIVLTGVNLTMYDHDGEGLGGLLEKMLKVLGPDIRLRLSSLEPDHIDDRLIAQLKDSRMQPYFHIPIQSASDKVIKRVNRKYDRARLEYVIGKIRQVKEDPLIACDVITGLPGESDEDFTVTRNFLVNNGFSLFHVFPFSPRPDTDLYSAKDRVPESVRDDRAKILRDISQNQYSAYVERQIGKEHEVILEEKKDGKWYGLTGNYIRVSIDGVPSDSCCGDLLRVKLISSDRAQTV